MKLYDQNGDECQITGLPHMFYDKVAVDERIAEMRKAFETSSTAEENKLRARVSELEKALSEATLCDDCGYACRKVCVNQGCDTL